MQAVMKSSNIPVNNSTLMAILNELMDKLGHNNSGLKDKAEELLLQMAGNKSFGVQAVFNNITKG